MPTTKIALFLLLFGASVLSGTPILATSVGVSQQPLPITASGADNQIYSVNLGSAIATAQSDYGTLRNYVYSNVGFPSTGGEASASTRFSDILTINSSGPGNLIVQLLIEGEITYTDTPTTGFNSQTFSSIWIAGNASLGALAQCSHIGAYSNVPSLPINCDLVVPIAAGLNTISFTGSLVTTNFGRASAVEMDFFNTSKVVSLGVFDPTGTPLSALITTDSGTTYPTGSSEVPEPGTAFLCGSSLIGAYFIRRCIGVLKKKQ